MKKYTYSQLRKDKMKAILVFNLPKEETEFKKASRAQDAFSFLWDLDIELRRITKHNSKEIYGKTFKTNGDLAEIIRKELIKLKIEES